MPGRVPLLLALTAALLTLSSLASTPPPPRTTWSLPKDFGGVQGENDWYYYQVAGGRYRPLVYDDVVSPWGRRPAQSWNSPGDGSRFLEIGEDPALIQTGEGADTAIGWKAPRAGKIKITGTMAAASTSREYSAWCGPECDDGIRFSIRRNGTVIAGPVRVLHGDPKDQRHTLTATAAVSAGDLIYFQQERGRWQDADAASYDFAVSYADVSTVTRSPTAARTVAATPTRLGGGGSRSRTATPFLDVTVPRPNLTLTRFADLTLTRLAGVTITPPWIDTDTPTATATPTPTDTSTPTPTPMPLPPSIVFSNEGRTMTMAASIFGDAAADPDGDGLVQAWEDAAMNAVNPLIELDEEEDWLDFRGTQNTANFVRVTPWQSGYPANLSAAERPRYVLIYTVISWAADFGRFGIESHSGDHERVIQAWRIRNAENKVLDLEAVFTSSHRDPNAHHGVWDARWSACCRGDVAWWPPEQFDHTEVMCGSLQFLNNRVKLQTSEDKHAMYPSVDVCEGVKLVASLNAGEDCGWDPSASEWQESDFAGDSRYQGSGRWLFQCHNVGEPDHWLLQGAVPTGYLNAAEPPYQLRDKLDSLYMMMIHTGAYNKSGTDAKITIELSGTNPYPYSVPLEYVVYSTDRPPRTYVQVGAFETGNTDYVCLGSRDMGDLTQVKISHDNSGSGPGWFLSNFWIRNKLTGKVWEFSPNQWLANDEPPHHRTWDEWAPVRQYQDSP